MKIPGHFRSLAGSLKITPDGATGVLEIDAASLDTRNRLRDRLFIVGPSHTFFGLSETINQGFARWDLSHLHEFELASGQRIGFVDPDWQFDDEPVWDHAQLKVASAVGPGDEFRFVFDFGDRWEHRCREMPKKVDVRQACGPGPLPVVEGREMQIGVASGTPLASTWR